MIDFRYHLVSLISVFLALAVGIVLGAGPLKEAIGDQLTGQVEALRKDKEDLRVALDAAASDVAGRDAFLEATAADLLAGTLPGRRVAIVELEPVDDQVLEALTAQLVTSGASVSARVTLGENWTIAEQAKFRQSLASSIVEYLEPAPTSQSTDAQLATALAQSLTSVSATDEDAFSERAQMLRELLVAGELVSFEDVQAPADLVLVVSAPPEVDADREDAAAVAEARAGVVQIQAQVASAAQAVAEAALVVGVAQEPSDLLETIAADTVLQSDLSTVDGGSELSAQITVPLALAARATGTVGAFGTQSDATAIAPPVVRLGTVDRSSRTDGPAQDDGAVAPEDEDPDAGAVDGSGEDAATGDAQGTEG